MSLKVLLKKLGRQETVQSGEVLKLQAVPNETYQLLDPKTGKTPLHIKKIIVGNDLILRNEDDNSEVQIIDYVS